MPAAAPTAQELKALAAGGSTAPPTAQELKALASGGPTGGSDPSLGQRLLSRIIGADDPSALATSRMGSTLAGAVGGGAIGSRIPPLPIPGGAFLPAAGALAGGATGAIAGIVAPEATIEMLEAFGVLPEGTRERVGLANEVLLEVAEAEALLDIATGGTFQAGRFAARGASRFLTGTTREGSQLVGDAAREGVRLPATAAGDSRFAPFFVSVFGRFPIIGGPMRKAGQAADKQIKAALEGVPERFAPVFSETDIGRQVFKNATTLVKKVSRDFGRRYDALFEEAEAAGVVVTPLKTLEAARDALVKIAEQTPKSAPGQPKRGAGKTLDAVKDFIRKELGPLLGEEAIQPQTLKEMDGLLSKIDQEIASLPAAERTVARRLLSDVSKAAKLDVVTNMAGDGAADIAARLRALDAEFSNTMRVLFETPTAKQFAKVRRGGLRGPARVDEATTTPVDQIGRFVVNTKSAQAVEELSRLVSKRTFRRITSRALDDVFQAATTVRRNNTVEFRPAVAMRKLGLDRKASGITESYEKMVNIASEGATDLGQIKRVLKAAEVLSKIEIPDMNAFIARRGTIGGFASIMRGLIPGISLAAAGGGAGVASGGGLMGMVVGAAVAIGGGRAVMKLLADPAAARALREVANETASVGARRAAAVKAIRATGVALANEGDFRLEAVDEFMTGVEQGVEDLKLFEAK